MYVCIQINVCHICACRTGYYDNHQIIMYVRIEVDADETCLQKSSIRPFGREYKLFYQMHFDSLLSSLKVLKCS